MTTVFRSIGGSLLAVILLLATAGCLKSPPGEQREAADNWILDTGFERGAMVFQPIPGSARVSGKLDFGRKLEGLKSEWIVSQWNSKSDIAKIAGKRDGTRYVYENAYKTLAVADDGTVTLGVDTGQEYAEPRSRPTDPWVHLYLEQRYKNPRSLKDGDGLRIRFDTRIAKSELLMAPEQYDPGLHAAIAVFYLIIGNSSGSGDFLNFCVPIYDNRHGIPPGEWHIDSGFNPAGDTHKLIYTLDGGEIYDSPTGDGQWHHVDVDLKPHIERALEIAKQNGYFGGVPHPDLGLEAIYIGWEVPGAFRSEMQIKNMAIGSSS
ncbi:hypothetical protein [Cohnella sp. REN36]|uniref:hypothetical protein n=1 Tax=Cohnella sp. REN36 TaxID=2887347 RepID=UPI001D1426B1|nr:hypothetical protein [Cohnella sp. REN36]MCC3375281.1 hypothetical protein [Cohnella sp. REN36]